MFWSVSRGCTVESMRNPSSLGKMAIKSVCACVCVWTVEYKIYKVIFNKYNANSTKCTVD